MSSQKTVFTRPLSILITAVLLLSSLLLPLCAGAEAALDPASEKFFALVDQHGPFHQWPTEEKESFLDMLYDEAYFLVEYVEGVPGDSDKSLEEALQIAKEAIIKVYGVTQESLDVIEPYHLFNNVNPDKPVWQIDFLPEDLSLPGFSVYLLGRTGEVFMIQSDEDSNG